MFVHDKMLPLVRRTSVSEGQVASESVHKRCSSHCQYIEQLQVFTTETIHAKLAGIRKSQEMFQLQQQYKFFHDRTATTCQLSAWKPVCHTTKRPVSLKTTVSILHRVPTHITPLFSRTKNVDSKVFQAEAKHYFLGLSRPKLAKTLQIFHNTTLTWCAKTAIQEMILHHNNYCDGDNLDICDKSNVFIDARSIPSAPAE